MGELFSALLIYYAIKYLFLIFLVSKGYSKTFFEIILTILPMIFFNKYMIDTPLEMIVIVETEFILSNLFLVLNVIVIKNIAFRLLVSITHDGWISKILCKFLNKKRLCSKLKELREIDYGPKLKQGIPAMVGRINKKTKVKFDEMGFPKFKSFYTVKIRRPDYKKSREFHFNYANKKIYQKALKSKRVRKLFTKNELNDF